MTSSSNPRQESVWIDKRFEMINQEFKAQGRQYQVLPNFGDILQRARGIQSYEFLRMRAQFLLCLTNLRQFFSQLNLRKFEGSLAATITMVHDGVPVAYFTNTIFDAQCWPEHQHQLCHGLPFTRTSLR